MEREIPPNYAIALCTITGRIDKTGPLVKLYSINLIIINACTFSLKYLAESGLITATVGNHMHDIRYIINQLLINAPVFFFL